MDTGLVYQALKDSRSTSGWCSRPTAASRPSTSSILKDDKGYFPTYALTPVVRKEALDANPKLADALNALSAKLDDATMARLNATVDVDKKTVEEVAQGFLKSRS